MDNKTTTVNDSSKPSTTTSAPDEGNTVRRSKDEPDALDTTPTSEPIADQPESTDE